MNVRRNKQKMTSLNGLKREFVLFCNKQKDDAFT